MIAVALTAPMLTTTRAASAASRHRVRSAAPHREADEPAETGPGQQHGRRPRHVGQQVRGQLVDERAASAASTPRPKRRRQSHSTPAPAQEHQRPDPEPVGHPVGQADGVAQPEPRSLRPQVGDDLVRYPAGELPGVEGVRRVADQPGRVQVEVELGVGRHLSGRRGQRRDVGQRGQQPDGQPGRRLLPALGSTEAISGPAAGTR